MSAGWHDVLQGPRPGDHIAQLYKDPAFLVEAVGHFVVSGLGRGEGVVLVMRQENWALLERRLQAAGADPAGARARGQLWQYEAGETLAALMKGGMPDAEAFRDVVGGAVTQARRNYPVVRAFGEMVDILWQRGHRVGAQHLEELWNDFIRSRGISLLCAYSMDPLHQDAYGGPIENVCKAHTHLIPAPHYREFDAAVSRASQEVLDRQLANMLHTLAATHGPKTGMPLGQATLMWLSENMPRTGERILNLVRARLSESMERAVT